MILICSIESCSAPKFSRGYCKRHYDRWRRHGDPLVCKKEMVPRGEPKRWLQEHALWAEIECLIWPFAKFKDGRAHMRAGKPARIMCEIVHGAPPTAKHEAAHSCGNGHLACVNPQHLRWATPSENSHDKRLHGTHIDGERHYASKLTADDVRKIRELAGSMQQKEIAKRFNVGSVCIHKIVHRQTWKGVL